jgi:signal transduction histidine kinase
MDLATLLALVAAIAALGALAVVLRRPAAGDASAVRDSLSAQLHAAQQGTQGQVELVARSVGDLRTELSRALGATEQQVATQAGTTNRTLNDLSRQLGTLSEQSQRIGDLAKDIGSLQDLLRAPKARGGFGELLLERLLHDALPAGAYEVQYTYKDGSRVDAIVRYSGRIVPIDLERAREGRRRDRPPHEEARVPSAGASAYRCGRPVRIAGGRDDRFRRHVHTVGIHLLRPRAARGGRGA